MRVRTARTSHGFIYHQNGDGRPYDEIHGAGYVQRDREETGRNET